MHRKQILILKRLEKQNGQRFADLSRGFDIDDKFPYHLKQLVKQGFMLKRDGLYFISTEVMRESASYSAETLEEIGLKVPMVGVVCCGADSVLIRIKTFNNEPNYFFSRRKVRSGETMVEAADALLKFETGMGDLPLEPITTHSRFVYASKGVLLFDSLTTYFRVDVHGLEEKLQLKPHNSFYSLEQIQNLPNTWPEIDLILNNKVQPFEEYSFTCDYNVQD